MSRRATLRYTSARWRSGSSSLSAICTTLPSKPCFIRPKRSMDSSTREACSEFHATKMTSLLSLLK
ncbi:Auxin responsive protein [Musa troglodytarum]|uniref:Auxin responsive protein n=1 Tax=Musa troglodytarum TaxID=320322 RepID=A0A9E7GFB9_9LILI|nr:Auxin responsive protein [Musa troglodytarum]